MKALAEEYADVRNVLAFEEAKANLISAARSGLQAQLAWDGRHETAADLVRHRLLPLAREGLRARRVDEGDIERYLGVIEARVERGRTGAQWALDSLAAMGTRGPRHGRFRALTAAALDGQEGGRPVHEWPLARHDHTTEWRHSYRTVGRFMTRDLFTVRPDDLVDLAANLMHWRHIRHVPVEDDEGRLLGIVSHRDLVRILARGSAADRPRPVAVREIMHTDPITVSPDTDTIDAISIMRQNRIGCLPVVADGRLVGIVTERDFIGIAARLVEEQLRQFDG
jgi:CBS domain-containing protein